MTTLISPRWIWSAPLLCSLAATAAPEMAARGTPRDASAPEGVSAAAILYDQTTRDTGVAIASQNFDATNDAFDSIGADDFRVPRGKTWKITEVLVRGMYYSGAGPAASVNVAFYEDVAGLPGNVIVEHRFIKPTTDVAGTFSIKLPTGLKLLKGKYWISVQANMAFDAGGQWGWTTRAAQKGAPAAWRNPANGFGTGCTIWRAETSCAAVGNGPDKLFTLKGIVVL